MSSKNNAVLKIYKANLSEFSESEYDRIFSMMDCGRKDSVLRKKIENDRKRSLLGEGLARKGISELCSVREREIEFGRTDSGKPFAKNVDVFFSISHSKDMVVCAVSDREIGIDAEMVRDIDLRITKIACTESDIAFIYDAEDEAERKMRFFRVWTAKEAYFKYLGTGIINLKDVSYRDIEPQCEMHIDGDYMVTVFCK